MLDISELDAGYKKRLKKEIWQLWKQYLEVKALLEVAISKALHCIKDGLRINDRKIISFF